MIRLSISLSSFFSSLPASSSYLVAEHQRSRLFLRRRPITGSLILSNGLTPSTHFTGAHIVGIFAQYHRRVRHKRVIKRRPPPSPPPPPPPQLRPWERLSNLSPDKN